MSKKNPWFDASKSHHTEQGFQNPEPGERQPGDLKIWLRQRKQQGLPKPPRAGYQQFIKQWWQPADFSGQHDAIWWFGHACLLIRVKGRYLLLDPALSKRASPLPFAGPARKTPVPVAPDQLPPIDAVIYSHNHYDHLDRASLRRLLKRNPQLQAVAPLGMGRWLRARGVKKVTECDWWQCHSLPDIKLHCTPARHWSKRTLWDRNRSLWCGWVIESDTWRVYFSGDSGYSPSLAEIGKRLGPFDIAALPIGAYDPEWFMAESHMSPEKAVILYQQLGAPPVIPIHWGVFELADESLEQPPQELARAKQAAGVDDPHFMPLKIGARVALPGKPTF